MMAMQQQDPRQMQQAPMAAYGMSMGGYDMPFYDDPYEMAYGGSLYRAKDGVTVNGITAERRNMSPAEGSGYKKGTVAGAGPNAQGYYRTIAGQKRQGNSQEITNKGNPANFNRGKWEGALCDEIKKGSTVDDILKRHYSGQQKYKAQVEKMFADCFKQADEIFTDKQDAFYNEEEGDTLCLCKKTDGSLYKDAQGNTKKAPTDADGNCLPYDKTCNESTTTPCVEGSDEYINKEKECTAAGKEFDGPNCDCVKTPGETPPKTPPEWWLQDTVNTMGAVSDLASVKKYMPWEARVDLEEPRPTFLDPTRELGQQSEQANIAAQASASFAGAQGLGARNAASQGQGAAQAANTLSNINNQNVNIANQFEGTQVGIRNQESMLNQQMANRVFDKNTIANQQFDNAKLAGRQNLRNSYNTSVTNKWKTDALNQMYPNYQTRPGVGGRVIYTPTDKKLDTTKRKDAYDAALAHCEGQGYKGDKGMNACMELYMKYHAAQYGGESFENGGYVYTVYPNY
jgi:hypothetical protein